MLYPIITMGVFKYMINKWDTDPHIQYKYIQYFMNYTIAKTTCQLLLVMEVNELKSITYIIHCNTFLSLFCKVPLLKMGVCVCVFYVSYYNSRVVSLPICYSLGCSSELAPRLEVLQLFRTYRHLIPHMVDPDFTTLKLWAFDFFAYGVVVCGISDWITQSGLENRI